MPDVIYRAASPTISWQCSCMHLVQILLPLKDNQAHALPRRRFDEVKSELTRRFKGLTAYTRSPAEGLWKPRRSTRRDEIVVYEVMTEKLNLRWWRDFKHRLERRFRQESIIIRAQAMRLL